MTQPRLHQESHTPTAPSCLPPSGGPSSPSLDIDPEHLPNSAPTPPCGLHHYPVLIFGPSEGRKKMSYSLSTCYLPGQAAATLQNPTPPSKAGGHVPTSQLREIKALV